jgi:hypothetical protein
MLVYFTAIWYLLGHLVFLVFWVYFSRFGMLYQENLATPSLAATLHPSNTISGHT